MPHSPIVFDRALLRERMRRALARGPETFLIDRVAADLAERLGAVLRQFGVAVDLGTPTDAVCDALADNAAIGMLVAASALARRVPAIVADEEALPLRDGSLDLVVSALALQFVNDLPGALVQIRRALKPDGLFLAALLGGDTLGELRQSFAAAESEVEGGVSPRVAPFADVREMGALLQRAGFALPVTDVERLTVRYSSPFILMSELRRMGATNALAERRRTPLRRATLARMAEVYAQRFADPDGKIRATFEVIWLSGWAPHESQQKPLRPGSAQVRLADALGTREIGTGDKAGNGAFIRAGPFPKTGSHPGSCPIGAKIRDCVQESLVIPACDATRITCQSGLAEPRSVAGRNSRDRSERAGNEGVSACTRGLQRGRSASYDLGLLSWRAGLEIDGCLGCLDRTCRYLQCVVALSPAPVRGLAFPFDRSCVGVQGAASEPRTIDPHC